MGLVMGGGNPATLRAHFLKPVVDNQGNLLLDCSVRLLEPGTLTPIADTIYSSSSGTDTRTNPWTATTGVIDFYLDTPQRVRIGVTTVNQPEVFFEDIDVLSPVEPTSRSLSVTDANGVTWYITVDTNGHLVTSTTAP